MVEFKTKLDNKKSKALNRFALKRMLWILILISVVLIAIGVIGILTKEDNTDMFSCVYLIIVGILFTPLMYFLTYILQKRHDKSSTFISSDTEEVYTFDEEYITITQTRKDYFSSVTKAKYSYVFKAYEDKNYFYLYISKVQCHIIDKASITQGAIEEAQNLLKTKLLDKFKIK